MGNFILTGSLVDDAAPRTERLITLTTAETHLREHRRTTPIVGGGGALRYGLPEVVRISGVEERPRGRRAAGQGARDDGELHAGRYG
jgi:hypothetical protein